MPTPAVTKANIASALETLMSAESLARMSSDFRTDLDQIPAGEARYQLRGWPGLETELPESNVLFRPAMPLELVVHYHLDSGESESTYTDGRMMTVLESLVDPDWWRDISGVFYIDSGPEAELGDIGRVGDVVSFNVAVTITVDES